MLKRKSKRMVVGNVNKLEKHLFAAVMELKKARNLYDCMNFNDGETIRIMEEIDKCDYNIFDAFLHFKELREELENRKNG